MLEIILVFALTKVVAAKPVSDDSEGAGRNIVIDSMLLYAGFTFYILC